MTSDAERGNAVLAYRAVTGVVSVSSSIRNEWLRKREFRIPDGVFIKAFKMSIHKLCFGTQKGQIAVFEIYVCGLKSLEGSNCVLGLKRVKLPKIAKNTLKTASLRELTNIFHTYGYCSGKKSVMLDVKS